MSELIRLPDPGILRLAGEDRIGFLNGLVSNDVARAGAGAAIYAALLTPQGRFLHDMLLRADGETLLIETRADAAADLLARLKRYRLRAKVELTDETGRWQLLAGPDGADGALDPRGLGRRILRPLDTPGPAEAPEAYDLRRLSRGVPFAPVDLVPEQSLLIEANLDRLAGIDWKKGCYVGQEITARMHYRGLAKKRLMIVAGPALPAPGTPLLLDGVEMGEMRSHRGAIGLALLKTETEGREVGDGSGKVMTVRAVPPVTQP